MAIQRAPMPFAIERTPPRPNVPMQEDPTIPKTGPNPGNEVGTTATMGKKPPIQTSGGGVPYPQTPPTFAQAQAAGLPRPAPIPGVPIPGSPQAAIMAGGSPFGGGGGMRDQIMQGLQALLANPGAAPGALEEEYNRGAEDIDDRFALDQKRLTDELAARGLGNVEDGTIGLGRMSDLNIGQRSAKTDLLTQLSIDAKKRAGEDLRAALGLASGYDIDLERNTIEREALGQRGAELAAQREFNEKRLAFDREVQAGRMSQDQADRELRKYEIDLGEKLGRDRLALEEKDTDWDNALDFLREIFGQDFIDRMEEPEAPAAAPAVDPRAIARRTAAFRAGF